MILSLSNMSAKLRILIAACVAVILAACGSSPQSLIVGRWEAESAAKVTAEFSDDGTAKLTMLGQTLRGTYKMNTEDELEWTVNGMTSKMKVHVTQTELEVTDRRSNQTIKYKRK